MNNDYIRPEDIKIPTSFEYDEKLHANSISTIGKYNTLIESYATNSAEMLFLFTSREAQTTTRLEGTNVTFEEVILEEDNIEKHIHKKSRVEEARGVFDAINEGKRMLAVENIPFSSRVIKAMHEKLMLKALTEQGVPGEFRTLKVSVGNRYFPPEPQHIESLVSDLEKFIHNDANISPIIKIAVTHAQFEIVHPFADGNGRIGRLLIPFLMNEFKLTQRVSYYLSPYFEKNKDAYFTALENITKHGDWDSWISFFLQSTVEYGNEMNDKINLLINLYKDGDFLKFSGSSSQHIKNYILQKPYFTVPQMIRYFERESIQLSNKKGLHKILKGLPDIEVLERGKGRRETDYYCPKIITIMHE